MPKIYAFQVDDETEVMIESDRATVSQAMGLAELLTPSQYLRLVIRDRIGKRSTVTGTSDAYKYDGYREGLRRGFAHAMKRFGTVITELAQTTDYDADNDVDAVG